MLGIASLVGEDPVGTAKANNKVGAKDNQALSLLRRGANGGQTVQRTVGISFWNKLSPIGEILFEEEIRKRVLSLVCFKYLKINNKVSVFIFDTSGLTKVRIFATIQVSEDN